VTQLRDQKLHQCAKTVAFGLDGVHTDLLQRRRGDWADAGANDVTVKRGHQLLVAA
jgi:hypothetical protein